MLPARKLVSLFAATPPVNPHLYEQLMTRGGWEKPKLESLIDTHDVHQLRCYLEAELVDFGRYSWLSVLAARFRHPNQNVKLVLQFYLQRHPPASNHVLVGTDIDDALYHVHHPSLLGLLLEAGCSPDFVPPNRSVKLRVHFEALGLRSLISVLDGYAASRETPRLFD